MNKVFIIAEIGINHNGNLSTALQMIDAAKKAGCDAVKFQKRTIDKVYTKEDLDKSRESPWGTTNRQQKNGLEFGHAQYRAIDMHCKLLGIEWFVSPWDVESVDFIENDFEVKYWKIPSALLTHKDLLVRVAKTGKKTFIATGMSTLEEIDSAITIFKNYRCPFEIMHCNSQYPMPDAEANLNCIIALRELFKCDVGYSCHSTGVYPPMIAVALGATSVEKHITLDRAMYGSDQAASVEPHGLERMVDGIRMCEIMLGDGRKRVTEGEEKAKAKLRRTTDVA